MKKCFQANKISNLVNWEADIVAQMKLDVVVLTTSIQRSNNGI